MGTLRVTNTLVTRRVQLCHICYADALNCPLSCSPHHHTSYTCWAWGKGRELSQGEVNLSFDNWVWAGFCPGLPREMPAGALMAEERVEGPCWRSTSVRPPTSCAHPAWSTFPRQSPDLLEAAGFKGTRPRRQGPGQASASVHKGRDPPLPHRSVSRFT